MLMRSSSTPILGSLSSSSDGPNSFELAGGGSLKLSFSSSHNNLHKFGCNSSPAGFEGMTSDGEYEHESGRRRGVRRIQSDGNSQGLMFSSGGDVVINPGSGRIGRRPSLKLETIPSFSVYRNRRYDEEDEEEEDGGEAGFASSLQRDVSLSGGSFSFPSGNEELDKVVGYALGVEGAAAAEVESLGVGDVLCLANGYGMGVCDDSGLLELSAGGEKEGGGFGCGGGGGGDGGGGGGEGDLERYYEKVLGKNPNNSMILRNYAQYLFQTKKDYKKAEEYFSRAILAEPGDGEILSMYAKLIWEVHHDAPRAESYFSQAIQAAPHNSYVLAAYASFLWDADEEPEESPLEYLNEAPTYQGAVASSVNS